MPIHPTSAVRAPTGSQLLRGPLQSKGSFAPARGPCPVQAWSVGLIAGCIPLYPAPLIQETPCKLSCEAEAPKQSYSGPVLPVHRSSPIRYVSSCNNVPCFISYA